MPKYLTLIPLFLILTLLLPVYGASSGSPKVEKVNPKVEELSVNITPQYLSLEFKLPYPGVVDFSLKEPNGTTLWRNYYVKEEGENKIRVRTPVAGRRKICFFALLQRP